MSATTNHIPVTHRRSRRSIGVGLGALAAIAVLGTACTDQQRRSLGEEDVRTSLASHVGAAVDAGGMDLDGDLDCNARIDADGAMTADCSGTTESGEAVAATYTGRSDVDDETCTAHLVTTIAGERVADEPAVPCFETTN